MNQTRFDLFQIAQDNVSNLENQIKSFDAHCSNDQKKRLQEFFDWICDECFVTIFMNPYILVELINGNTYKNMYEWAKETELLSGRPKEDCLKEKLGNFYNKRTSFDCSFVEGEGIK